MNLAHEDVVKLVQLNPGTLQLMVRFTDELRRASTLKKIVTLKVWTPVFRSDHVTLCAQTSLKEKLQLFQELDEHEQSLLRLLGDKAPLPIQKIPSVSDLHAAINHPPGLAAARRVSPMFSTSISEAAEDNITVDPASSSRPCTVPMLSPSIPPPLIVIAGSSDVALLENMHDTSAPVEPESSSDEDLTDADDESHLIEVTLPQLSAQYTDGVNVSEWLGTVIISFKCQDAHTDLALDLYQQSSIDKWGELNHTSYIQLMRLQWKRDR